MPPRLEPPRLWIVAGPNGSGKSTLYNETGIEGFGRSVWIINPDLLSDRIHRRERLEYNAANAEALRRIEAWLLASVRAHQTVGVETVLSTAKYRPLVKLAKTMGFEVRLLYVLLNSVDLNIERVRKRVANGGHDVPENKIRERRERSFKQLPWFLAEADFALIFDNSGPVPNQIAKKSNNVVEIDPSAPEPIKRAATHIKNRR